MLVYNILIVTVGLLLALDYYVHKYDVHLQSGGNRLALGNTFLYVSFTLIIFFAGFRFEIGYDYTKYFAAYLYDSELSQWEPIFTFLIRLSREVDLGLGSQFMFLLFSTITLIIVYKALRSLTPHYRLGLFLYLLIPSMYLNSFSVIRQGIALAILLYGLQYIVKDKPEYKKYMLAAFFAFMFHYSSLFVSVVLMLGAPIFKHVYSWVFYGFLAIASFFLSFAHFGKLLLSVMPGHFSLYANNQGFSISILKLLVVNAFFLFLLWQKDKFLRSKMDIYLFNMIFIGLLIFNVFSDFVFVSRLAQYFLVVEIIIVPIYLYSIKDLFMRKVMMILFLLYYLFNFNYALLRDKNSVGHDEHHLVPYKNYFFEEKKSNNMQLEYWYNYISEYIAEEEERQK